jgi:hypothetical protein
MVNNSFSMLPAEATFDAWRERAPDGFRFVAATLIDLLSKRGLEVATPGP